MTVYKELLKNRYLGNGETTVFPFTFETDENHPEYIYVYIGGEDVNKIELTTDYTLDMQARTITYPKSADAEPLAVGERLIIYRWLPIVQLLDLLNQGPYFAEDIEQSLDDLTFICQQLKENLDRCIHVGLGIDPEEDGIDLTLPWGENKSFAWNEDGSEIVLVTNPDDILAMLNETLEKLKEGLEKAIAEIRESLEALHTADVEYVILLVQKFMEMLQYAKELLLTDLRYPTSDYYEVEKTYGLENAVLLVNASRLMMIEDLGGCER